MAKRTSKQTTRKNRIDFSKIKTYPLKDRKSKVSTRDFGKPSRAVVMPFIETLPDILGAKDLRSVIDSIVTARIKKRPVIAGMGAHLTKVGLNPILIDLMESGILTGIAVNGAVIIHDFELAVAGKTSEDVEEQIRGGKFGMAEETGRYINEAIIEGASENIGIGKAVGRWIEREKPEFREYSVLAAAYRLGIPVTVHVAIGTDIIHLHPQVSGASLGDGSLIDFKTFCEEISRLEGGVFMNIGSAVILPEVFLKALTVARNLGYRVNKFTTVNLDFIQHYRPNTNVVHRPTQNGGEGYSLTGHHEIMVPLIAAAVKERLRDQP